MKDQKKVLLLKPNWQLLRDELSEASYFHLTFIKFPLLVELEEGYQNVVDIKTGDSPLWNLDWFEFYFIENLLFKYLL